MRKITNLLLWVCTIILVGQLFSCTQKAANNQFLQQAKISIDGEVDASLTYNAIPSEELPPIKAEYIDPSTITPPIIIPLKGTPKVVQTHTNVRLAGTPKVIPIPSPLKRITLGKDGVPLPEIIPAKSNIIPDVLMKNRYKSTPVQAFRTKDEAIYNIQFLGLDQGLDLPDYSFILEDSRGDLLFGWQNNSICRFDGKNLYQGVGPSLDLMEDSKGNIWMAGVPGLVCNNGQNVLSFPIAGRWPLGLKEDSKGNIWFVDSSGNIYSYDGQNFTIFKGKFSMVDFETNLIGDIEEDQQGNIWIATQGNGVLRYDGQTMTSFTEREGLLHNNVNAALTDSQGRIWFGTKNGVSIYTPNTAPTAIHGSFSNYTTKEGLSDNYITSIIEDKSNNIWLATLNKGINRFDGKTFTHFTTKEGLSADVVRKITEDHQGNIWVATHGGGINRLQPNSFQHFTDEHGLSENAVRAVMEDSKGNIWMGTPNSGVMKYDGKSFTHFTEKEGLPNNTVNSILEDSKGNMWFGSFGGGVSRFDGHTFTKYNTEQEGSGKLFVKLTEDKMGRIWISSFNGKITRLNPETGQIARFAKGQSGIMTIGKTKQLWMIAEGYAAKYDAQNDAFNINYQWEPYGRFWGGFQLADNQHNNVWIGSRNSLIQIKKNGQTTQEDFPSVRLGRGLPAATAGATDIEFPINSMHVDHQQRIWTAGEGGIFVGVDKLENLGMDSRWIHYKIRDGLKDIGYTANSSFYQDSKNRLWIFSNNNAGITFLDLNTFELPTEAPQNLSLSHIDVKGQPLDYRLLSDSLYQTTMAFGKTVSQAYDSVAAFQNYPKNLKLPYDLNHLTFHFTAKDWTAPHKIQYSYQMESIDTDWSEPSAETKADYRNLSYGTHTFQVKAIGEAQVWSDTFDYTFTILPPWWHTWWAYGLYALLTIGTAGWYVRRLNKQLQQKQAQLDKEQYLNQELTELNEANSRFVPHDFLQTLGKTSLKELKLGDQVATKMTILFADIRDYTTLSEKITPEENFKFINAFLGRVGPVIQANGGFISQYMGDGIMALFRDNHGLAVQAAIDMQQAIHRYNKKRFAQNRAAIRVGIGLNTGQLMLGIIGDNNRYDASVISDAVNTASRMEGLTKIFGCGVIISESTLVELLEASGLEGNFPLPSNLEVKQQDSKLRGDGKSPRNIDYRFLGKIKVKGKSQIIKIFDCYEGDSEHIRILKSQTKANFEKAIHFYFDRKFGKAADLFKGILAQFPEDVATEYYMEKAVKFVVDGVDAEWNGVETMMLK